MSGPVKLSYKVTEPNLKTSKHHILLLHGITNSKETFDEIAEDLANRTGRKLYSLDLRNHGDSEWSDVFTIDSMAKDVVNFMDDQNISSAILFGFSLGGRVAMSVAFTYLNRIEKLIVDDMTPRALNITGKGNVLITMKLFYEALETVPCNVDFTKASEILFHYISSHYPKDSVVHEKGVKDKIRYLLYMQNDGKYTWKMNLQTIIAKIEDLRMKEDMRGFFDKPALFLYATHSAINLGNDKTFILNLFPQAEFCEFEATHYIHYDRPEEMIREIVRFLA